VASVQLMSWFRSRGICRAKPSKISSSFCDSSSGFDVKALKGGPDVLTAGGGALSAWLAAGAAAATLLPEAAAVGVKDAAPALNVNSLALELKVNGFDLVESPPEGAMSGRLDPDASDWPVCASCSCWLCRFCCF